MTKKALWYKSSGQSGKGAVKKLKPIRRLSKARCKLMTEYLKRVKIWKLNPVNLMCGHPHCGSKANDCHHKLGRAGKLILDERYWVPVCQTHHEWIHTHPEAARKVGLLCAVGKWNSNPQSK